MRWDGDLGLGFLAGETGISPIYSQVGESVMSRAGAIILFHELRRIIAAPPALLCFIVTSATPVALRIALPFEFLILELSFYGGLIGSQCILMCFMDIEGRQHIGMQVERGAVFYSGAVRIIFRSVLSLLLCSVGIVFSCIYSETEWQFWIYLWITCAGTILGLAAIANTITIGFIIKQFHNLMLVFLLILTCIGSIYSLYLFLGIILTAIVTSLTVKMQLAAGYAFLFAVCGVTLFFIVGKRMPRRMSICRKKHDIPKAI